MNSRTIYKTGHTCCDKRLKEQFKRDNSYKVVFYKGMRTNIYLSTTDLKAFNAWTDLQ